MNENNHNRGKKKKKGKKRGKSEALETKRIHTSRERKKNRKKRRRGGERAQSEPAKRVPEDLNRTKSGNHGGGQRHQTGVGNKNTGVKTPEKGATLARRQKLIPSIEGKRIGK